MIFTTPTVSARQAPWSHTRELRELETSIVLNTLAETNPERIPEQIQRILLGLTWKEEPITSPFVPPLMEDARLACEGF
jgi:hypothetical protein